MSYAKVSTNVSCFRRLYCNHRKSNSFQIKELKVFSWLVVGYFEVMLLSISVADDFNAEFHHLERKLQFLLALLIALTIFKVDFPLKKNCC
ncbi:hypothetical protein [bacterium endosymbiont of Bathymodiolus sp. 5 South]|jgi:hypothetical protein|uniref:hypothetical protein n=1 Tax=bacterium endosymbiont of Bathymodiolus sp. 5 South TaxID=1181670 RepID=UPI001117DDBC|nr:hypothetical protein [bacterium endosymbiont of Bathymodiolus sp. 5 South]VVH61615.1 hypothetical protein BSPWISOX_281 [uncultured Gammaproteobacteria bacterium]